MVYNIWLLLITIDVSIFPIWTAIWESLLINLFYSVLYTEIEESGCFDSKSMVKVQDSNGYTTTKSLEDLAVGDCVQSFDIDTKKVTFSPVYYIIYENDNERLGRLRELVYDETDGTHQSLRLHPKHLVYSTPSAATKTPGYVEEPPTTPSMSENVNVDEIVWVIEKSGQLTPRRVVQIREVITTVRHPMTLNHTIIVDNVLASVHMHNEWLLRQSTSPLRLLYYVSPRLNDLWVSKTVVHAWEYVERYFLE